jgi:hypothetical protein
MTVCCGALAGHTAANLCVERSIMSELKSKLLGLKELQYQVLSLLLDSMRPNDHVESFNSGAHPSHDVLDPVL